MKKVFLVFSVFALALTIYSCTAEGSGDTNGDTSGVQAGVAFGDSGAPGGAADAWQSSLRD